MTAPEMREREKQITVREFCCRYGVGVTTTYKLIGKGLIIARKYGHRTLIDIESAEAWRLGLPRVEDAFPSHESSHKSNSGCGEGPRRVAKTSSDASH